MNAETPTYTQTHNQHRENASHQTVHRASLCALTSGAKHWLVANGNSIQEEKSRDVHET